MGWLSFIPQWFRDRSERNNLVKSFNESARHSFYGSISDAMLVADIVAGVLENRHSYTNFLFLGGFRIKTTAGRVLSKDEMLYVGTVILTNQELTRRLFVLGWDTLIVEDNVGGKKVSWAIKDFVNLYFELPEKH